MSRLHYEFIPTRPVGEQYRVADESDDPVHSFATEKEAQQYVRLHNAQIKRHPEWKE